LPLALVNTIDLTVILKTELLGVFVALFVITISSKAVTRVATPLLVAEIAPSFVSIATILVAALVVIISKFVLIITSLYYNYIASKIRRNQKFNKQQQINTIVLFIKNNVDKIFYHLIYKKLSQYLI
jgi:hypothetical protein